MTKHKSPDERAEQILTAAKKCFLEKGFFATKMDEIAAESGLSKGGIYFHFDSKQEIFRALVQQEFDDAVNTMDAITDSADAVSAKLATLGMHFGELFEQSDNPRFGLIMGEMGLRDPEVQQLLATLQKMYFERIERLLHLSMEQGEMRRVDPRAAAVFFKGVIDGIQINYAIGVEIDLETVIATAVDVVMHGLTP